MAECGRELDTFALWGCGEGWDVYLQHLRAMR